jgi:hypothetical protein
MKTAMLSDGYCAADCRCDLPFTRACMACERQYLNVKHRLESV